MSYFKIRRPVELDGMQFEQQIIIGSKAVNLPLQERIEQGGAVAYFNGFKIDIHPGDVIEELYSVKEEMNLF